jgi:hypothetical protein
VSDTADLERIRPLWESLNRHPNAQVEFFSLINEVRGNVIKPYITVLERNGEPSGLLAGRFAWSDFCCRLGYKTIRLGKVKELSIVYGGILGCDDKPSAEAVLSELNGILNDGQADVVFLSHLKTDCPLFELANRSPGILRRDHLVSPQNHWKTTLPGTHADFLKRLNKKHRYWVRRLEKSVQEDFPGQIAYRSFTDGQNLAVVLNDLESVAQKTYQRQLGAGFRNDDEHNRRFALEAAKGWLRIYLLYLADRPVAFWVGTLYKEVFYSGFTGYDPQYRHYELGTLVFMKMVENLCAEGCKEIDYGFGDALYKQRFGDQNWQEASVRVFSPSIRPILLNVTRTAIETPAVAVRWALRRTDIQQRIKTLWRKKLIGNEKS